MSTEKQLKICSWCNKPTTLLDRKKYCFRCASLMYRECFRCKLPFDNRKYFTLDEKRCNSCQKKYLQEKEKREQSKLKDMKAPSIEVQPGTSAAGKLSPVHDVSSDSADNSAANSSSSDDEYLAIMKLPVKIQRKRKLPK